MAEFKLERFKYSWKGNWSGGTDYNRDDIVKVGGKSYVCLVTHTANSDFNIDLNAVVPGSTPPIPAPKWKVMTDSRAFVGTWAAATVYQLGDIVTYDGTLWACTTGHTSSPAFATDASKWTIFADHIKFKADWINQTGYGRGAIVKYNGIVYRCLNPHVSGSTLEANASDWEVFHDGVEYAGNYNSGSTYRKNDLVKYGGSIWKCNETHIGGIPFDESKFDILLVGFQYDGEWQADTYYQIGDVVSYGGYLYYATNNSINIDPFVPAADSSNYWTPLALTYNFRGGWSVSANYKPGDIVERGGSLYLAKSEISGFEQDGSTLDYLDDSAWEVLIPSQKWSKQDTATSLGAAAGNRVLLDVTVVSPIPGEVGNKYVVSGEYRPVIRMVTGFTYVFDQTDLTNVYYPNQPDGSSFNPHPLNFSSDNLSGVLGGGTAYLTGVHYFLNDTEVSYATYNDYDAFKDATTRRVEIEVDELTPTTLYYWCYRHTEMGSSIDVVAPADETGTWQINREYHVGEVVYYYGTAWKCNYQHVSTNQNFPGDNGSGIVFWDLLIESATEAGLNYKGDLLTYNLNRTLQGDGSSFGPTNLPIGQSEQLLSVTTEQDIFWRNYVHDSDVIWVRATDGMDAPGYGLSRFKPFKTIKHACEYVLDNYTPLTPVIIKIATGRYVEAGPITVPAGCALLGDELRSVTVVANDPLTGYSSGAYVYKKAYVQHLLTYVSDLLNNIDVNRTTGNTIIQDKSTAAVGSAVPNTIAALVDDHDDYLDFYLGGGGTNPSILSTNTATTDSDYLTAIQSLINNETFIVEETKAFLTEAYPSYAYDADQIARDVRHFLRALKYDLRYTGNYMTILHARDFKNRARGSQFDDLFYLRDTTGMRNMTLTGLRGTLNPPGVFDLYQRPTGGAFTALDPGWGPNDSSTWIINRSPYIQGITNIGSNCVGQRIDGAAHNGGNKSMTSNDYTQVLSDGIGAWVLNNGRAELVSVFTYYCQIGYLADAGGVIRATNGNNSYGTYGCIADGNDSTETPQEVEVFNRNQEASIESVFAGEFTDQIFAVEYSHAGEAYTQASASIIGSGVNASVAFEDIRDGGLFQVRLLNSDGSGVVGGNGYGLETGNAQDGNTTTITLDNSSGFAEEDILGRRLIITSGDGTGQYGYISAYNNGTKVATISRESDGTTGWDHLVSGTPIATSLTTNTQYRIEPRVTFSAPGFSSSNANIPQERDFVDIQFSDTTSIFADIEAADGTGTTIDVVAAPAIFTVTRVGQTYSVTFSDFGAGYAVGDVITVLGQNLGGSSPTNDLTITVTSVTDDSTNAISTYTVEGRGIPGKFVAIATPNFAAYSSDATNWTETLMPFVGNWRKVIAGNNRFVAIAKDSDRAAVSLDGISWTASDLPTANSWNDIAYGNGKFVAIAENVNTIAVSSDGITWTEETIPDDVDPDSDSTAGLWQKITYGAGKFVAVSGNNQATAISTDAITWTRYYGLPVGTANYVSLAYGNNRFVLVEDDGTVSYSFNGQTWLSAGSMPTEDGSTVMNWRSIKYLQGLFVAVCDTENLTIGADPVDGTTTYFAVSEDGIIWTERSLPSAQKWEAVTYGKVDGTGHYVAIAKEATINGVAKFQTGARAKGRVSLTGSTIDVVKILDPGSGYEPDNPPTMTIVDNSFTVEVAYETRIGNGVLAQPSWINRGLGYRTSSTSVTITGDGYADIYPDDTAFITLSGVTVVPSPGAQIRFDNLLNDLGIDQKLFNAITIEDLGDDGTGNNTKLIRCRLSPSLDTQYDIENGRAVTIRERYSQCRVTNHDFLDIGTGNFEETNYPELYAGGAYFIAAPENEVYEENGGRVFYTSSDQDGNFRAGELFSVQQSTGIVTISADFFDLDGLSELALGGVRLGGSGAVVREFSTDVTFAEDSNNVVPTQRAIATFLANRLSVGGSDLETNSLIAGRVRLGGQINEIGSTTGINIRVPVMAEFSGAGAQIDGLMLMYPQFLRTYNDSVQ